MDFDGDEDVDLYDEATFGMILEDEAEEEQITRRGNPGRGGCGCSTVVVGLAAIIVGLTVRIAMST